MLTLLGRKSRREKAVISDGPLEEARVSGGRGGVRSSAEGDVRHADSDDGSIVLFGMLFLSFANAMMRELRSAVWVGQGCKTSLELHGRLGGATTWNECVCFLFFGGKRVILTPLRLDLIMLWGGIDLIIVWRGLGLIVVWASLSKTSGDCCIGRTRHFGTDYLYDLSILTP